MRIRRASSRSGVRSGITLLEVIAATAIFLLAVVALHGLMNSATNLAIETQQRSRATRLCQSKLNEFVAGVESLTSAGGGDFEEDPEWSWSADIQPDSVAPNLYVVTVTVKRTKGGDEAVSVSMSQMIFDPAQRGQVTGAASTDTSGMTGTTTGGTTTGGTTGGTGGMTGGGTGGMTGGGNTGGGGTTPKGKN